MQPMIVLLALLCGMAVGFTLGLIGGGGSVLATPLLLYVVGLEPHVAIGTGAFAVSVNAFANFASHARAGHVRWRCAGVFAGCGMLGALAGSTLGKIVEGQHLLFLFALVMILVGILMLRRNGRPVQADGTPAQWSEKLWLVALVALCTGMLSGFFGIGGGFLIVPGLLFATNMPMISAIGTSLLAVGAFGLTTAVNYAASGLVDWLVAAEYIVGGIAGGVLGMRLARLLAKRRTALTRIFAAVVFAVAAIMLWRSTAQLGWR